MKGKLGMPANRPLADFLPTVTIAAKNLAAEITNHNVRQNDLTGESSITSEHVQNNTSVRNMLGERGIKPEELPPEEDIKKLERRVKSAEKKLIKGCEMSAGESHNDQWPDINILSANSMSGQIIFLASGKWSKMGGMEMSNNEIEKRQHQTL